MGKLDFVYTTSGLEASFRVISKVPVKAILDWDFGDDKGEVFNGKRHESYSYEGSGFYTVTLTVSDSSGLNETVQKQLSFVIMPILLFLIVSIISLTITFQKKSLKN